MIATTIKNGKCVRLTADFQLDVEKLTCEVYCDGVTFEFTEFSPAARVYKNLSYRIESETFTSEYLKHLVAGARAMGYSVKEIA